MAKRTRLEGRTAVITGADGGAGRAIALSLARRRCHLAPADVDDDGIPSRACRVSGGGRSHGAMLYKRVVLAQAHGRKGGKMRRLILLLIFCSIPLDSPSAQDLKLPASPAEIQRMAARRPLPRIVTLPPTEKIKQVQLALKGKIQPSPTNSFSSPLTLDPRNSYVEGKAKLYFEWASVYTDDNEVVFDQDGKVQPQLRLFYNVTTPGYYVFDFTIENTTPEGRNPELLFLNVFVDKQTKTPGKGTQHQIFVTDMKSPGWYVIVLSSPQGFWKFYSLEVSQFK